MSPQSSAGIVVLKWAKGRCLLKKDFFWLPSRLWQMALCQMGHQQSAKGDQRQFAAQSRTHLLAVIQLHLSRNTWTQMCSKQLALKMRPIFFVFFSFCSRGNLTQVPCFDWLLGFAEASFKYVITQNASGPTFIWGLGNFKFVIFTNFSTFNPAPLIASSAMQIQLQLPSLPPPPTICN